MIPAEIGQQTDHMLYQMWQQLLTPILLAS
jgi:hypothetical protein